MDEAKLRESAVAELRVDRTASDAVWAITSRDRLVDQAIAEALPTERRDGSPESCGLVRTVLADEAAIRIKDAGSVLGGRGLLEGAGEQCPCREGGGAMRNEKYGCLCGCHFGMICRESIVRKCHREAPQAAFLFTFLSAPALGPVYMESTSWGLCLWLREITRDGGWRDGPLDARLRLQRNFTRTRSGIEVALAQPTIRLLRGSGTHSVRAVDGSLLVGRLERCG